MTKSRKACLGGFRGLRDGQVRYRLEASELADAHALLDASAGPLWLLEPRWMHGTVRRMSTWRFDDHTGTLDQLVFELRGDDVEADWNLGRDGAFWLSGTIEGPLAPGVVGVDMRALDETIFLLMGVKKTFYPLDQRELRYPLEIRDVADHRVRVHLDVELDWDYFPAPTKPANYRTHRFSLEAEARLVRP